MLASIPMEEQTGAEPADDGNRAESSMQLGQEQPVREHSAREFVLYIVHSDRKPFGSKIHEIATETGIFTVI